MHSAVVALALGAAAVAPFASRAAAPTAGISHEDLLWLNRITYGADATTVAAYARLGRSRFLDAQLKPRADTLPAEAAAQVARLAISDPSVSSPEVRLASLNAENQRINGLPSDDDKQAARKAVNDEGNALAYDAARRHLLRAIYSAAQLEEQLTWFWLNHFSVFQGKANIRWLIADYESSAIRPHVLGRFRDLVLATLEHPAMLQYLDNAQNAVGSSGAGLFDRQDDADAPRVAFPQLATRFYYDDIEETLGARTRAALDQALSQAEWNTYLLSSPELNYR